MKKNAAIAEAEAERDRMQKTSEAKRLGTEAQLKAETQIALAKKEKELRVQSYKEEEQKAQAKADYAYEVEQNIVKKNVIEALKNTQLFEEQRQTEIAMQQAIKQEKELEATVKKVAEAQNIKNNKELMPIVMLLSKMLKRKLNLFELKVRPKQRQLVLKVKL